jgi:hypothetical protein
VKRESRAIEEKEEEEGGEGGRGIDATPNAKECGGGVP